MDLMAALGLDRQGPRLFRLPNATGHQFLPRRSTAFDREQAAARHQTPRGGPLARLHHSPRRSRSVARANRRS
jgi:hypothetical protein